MGQKKEWAKKAQSIMNDHMETERLTQSENYGVKVKARLETPTLSLSTSDYCGCSLVAETLDFFPRTRKQPYYVRYITTQTIKTLGMFRETGDY